MKVYNSARASLLQTSTWNDYVVLRIGDKGRCKGVRMAEDLSLHFHPLGKSGPKARNNAPRVPLQCPIVPVEQMG